MNKINDFGEKIGGAKKDMWRLYGLKIEDFYEMTPQEKRSYVVRDNIWPLKPSKELVDAGMDPFLIFWRRECRKKIEPKPTLRMGMDFDDIMITYIKVVTEVRDIIMAVQCEAEMMNAYTRLREKMKDQYHWSAESMFSSIVSCSLPYLDSCHNSMKAKIKRTNFPYAETKCKERKKGFIPPQLTSIHRDGVNFRNGRSIRPSEWQQEFAFRGVEFGNWMSQDDRRYSMNYCYDALRDLANCLGISNRSISFHGNLALAFGARGSSRAMAHYEPMRQVINLTKIRGAGSTAHEWMHALDHQIALQLDPNTSKLASERPNSTLMPKSFIKLLYGMVQDDNGRITDFYRNSQQWDHSFAKAGHGYWSSYPEMLARAFAVYIKDRFDGRSDYLNAHAECNIMHDKNGKFIPAYPIGQDRERLNVLFDDFFTELKEIGFFDVAEPSQYKEAVIPIIATASSVNGEVAFSEDDGGQLSLFA